MSPETNQTQSAFRSIELRLRRLMISATILVIGVAIRAVKMAIDP